KAGDLLRPHVIVLAVADFVVAEDIDFDVAEGVCGAARVRIIGEAVLGAKFAIDLVEDDSEVGGAVRKKHGAAGCLCDGVQGVWAGSVAATFVLYGANQDCVQERIGSNSSFSRGIKIGAAGGLATVGDEDNDVASLSFLRG